ncbi:MAG: leucine-rich repeat domain-containing protein, partial [Lachnospiraceae bacterium]|nr:leucine-rich repeat domain-containing protein [Lachnospiraceae bacterium]
TEIGFSAFDGCGNLTGDLTIPNGVTVIGHNAFSGCKNLGGTLTVPKSVRKIDKYAFSNCTGFSGTLTIPEGVAIIGGGAFYNCKNFTGELRIPDSVHTIDTNAFYGCSSLERLELSSGVVSMGKNIISACNSIQVVANRSGQPVSLPVIGEKTWEKYPSGNKIKRIANGTAVRDDFDGEIEENTGGLTYVPIPAQTFSAVKLKPPVDVYYGDILLKEKTDYTISFSNNTNAGTEAKFTIKGKGNYAGTENGTFTILAKNLNDEDVTVSEIASIAYNNKKTYTPVPAVTFGKKKLKNKTDFTVAYYTDASCSGESVTPKEAGRYYAKISGKKNYDGSVIRSFAIAGAEEVPVSKLTIAKIPDQVYDGGSRITPAPVVKQGSTVLTAGTDYDIIYGNNSEIGTASVTIIGKGKYKGARTVTFKIKGIPMNKVAVKGFAKSVVYEGTPRYQNIELSYTAKKGADPKVIRFIREETYRKLLPEDQKEYDCTVSYRNNVNVGTATVVFTGVNGCSGTVKKTFRITPFEITKDRDDLFVVRLSSESTPYKKGGARPKPVVTYQGTVLTEGKDYTLSYANNTALNDGSGKKVPTVKVKGKGNFKGTDTSTTFVITSAAMEENGVFVSVNDVVFADKKGNWKPKKVMLTDSDGKTLKAGRDYDDKNMTFTYEDESPVNVDDTVEAGTVIKITVPAKGTSYTGQATGSYRVVKKDIGKLNATVEAKEFTGGYVEISGADVIWKSGKNVVDGVTFTIDETTYKNNVKKGTATVMAYGTGDYGGSKKITFKIGARKIFWW